MKKIYTKSGDRGWTGHLGGGRVPKNDPRIEAGGELDELSSLLGLLAAWLPEGEKESAGLIRRVQSELLNLGARLSSGTGGPGRTGPTQELEAAIDRMQAELPELKGFILPGGHQSAALAHLARAVCRRAERRLVALAQGLDGEAKEEPGPDLAFLNRLSDYLFVLARYLNHRNQVPDVAWEK
ncbi:MAG: cob(I)yrinic acid a,c-diamide adenosyltransferase [Thermodesulfobacteriota bacterium]